MNLILARAAALAAVPALLLLGTGSAPTQAGFSRPVPAPTAPTAPTAPAATAPAVGAAQLTDVAFTSPQHGYGLVNTGSSGTCHEAVASTANGGATFGRPVLVAAYTCGDALPGNTIAADGLGDVFVFGPALFISHDDGRSFARSAIRSSVLGVTAIGRSVWLLRQHCSPAPKQFYSNCRLRLLMSADGGRSWYSPRRQPYSGTYRRYPVGQTTGPFSSQNWLVRTGRKSGYILVPYTHTRLGAPLWYTSTAGGSWTRRQIPCRSDADQLSAVPRSSALFAVCSGQPGSFPPWPAQYKEVAVSANGGRTWRLHSPCSPNINKDAECTLAHGWLTSIAAPSTRQLFLTAEYGSLRVSDDRGARWHYLFAPADALDDTWQVKFFGRSDGIVVGLNAAIAATIWHTSDGGTRWRQLHPVIG